MKSTVKKNDWPALATALGDRFPSASLHTAVRAWASSAPAGGRWGLAFSGGADSLALLLLLWAHWPERRAGLLALHFNHRLRGRDSVADVAFCRRVCASLGIAFVLGEWKHARKGASEAEARAARFEFFERELLKRRIKALWFGHQQNDIAETALMRLARGGGTAGLAAPRPLQTMPDGRVHLRPLLTLQKKAIEQALRKEGASWREDASNATGDYFRNRVRHEVLPAWIMAASDRDALAGAALSRELLDEDDVALENWLDGIAAFDAEGRLDIKALTGKPRAIIRRALYRWLVLQKDAGDLSRQGFALLLAMVEQGGATRFSLGSGGFAVIRKGWLFFEKNSHSASILSR